MNTNRNRTFLYISWNRAGFCSEFNQLLLAFAYSIFTKRYFLIDSRLWNYGRLSDYFDIPFNNNYPSINRTFLSDNSRINDQIAHLKTTRIGTQVRRFWIATQPVHSIMLKRQAAHYLWRTMSNETRKFVERYRIGNISNSIGIHIRKGDKIGKEAREIPLKKYIKSIERLFKKDHRLQQIFVASDDRTVINKLRRLKPIWHFVSIHDNNNDTSNRTGHFQFSFNLLPRKQKLVETRLLLTELQMLIDSKFVVCGMSSNVCRLIQTLRYQHPSTVISLDHSWRAT
ncbi:unnamed protein product [Adineta ricciae]|uniref:Alpha-(1,6)-fucosyltransferase N- and catalytic domain-containing protein n=1 Tax=Adineta ricciae TaxID=249248 RepID=A0A815EFJ9_ADIRI|nr:unnamed protein product [Adineta ricciae]CAF1310740.1 unnamed protein product [Adineta ricciae]